MYSYRNGENKCDGRRYPPLDPSPDEICHDNLNCEANFPCSENQECTGNQSCTGHGVCYDKVICA